MNLKHIRIRFRLILKKIILDLKQTHIKDLRNLILLYLKKLPDIIHLKNLVLFNAILAIIVLVMFAGRFSAVSALYRETEPAFGGVYREGVIGSIEKINPLFIQNNAEAAASKLVYSGLARVMPGGEVVPDLAESWKVENDTTYVVKLKDNLKWHDGHKLTVDDVIFTIGLIQSPDTRTNRTAIWRGATFEKISANEIKFTLPNPNAKFLNILEEPILPQHLLTGIDPKNVKVASLNRQPVGSGPYRFVRFDQAGNEPEVVFTANKDFVFGQPYISEVRLKSYETFEGLYQGVTRKQIDGIKDIPYENLNEISKISNFKLYKSYLPRYKSLIFNLKNDKLADIEVRKAVSLVINRGEILAKGAFGQGETVFAPVLPGQIGYSSEFRKEIMNVQAGNDGLDKAGWIKDTNGIRKKDGKELEFRLVSTNDPEDMRVAKELASELSTLGIKINSVFSEVALIQADYIRPRNFDFLLIGQSISADPDLYSFWHSSQIADPGLNISSFKDKAVDKFLEQIKKSTDPQLKADRLIQTQKIITTQLPAIYLYNPVFTIAVSKNIKGIPNGGLENEADHLSTIYKWYIRENIK